MARAGRAKQKPMTLRSHLLELRNRFFLVAGVLIIAATIAYSFRDPLISALMAPLEGRQLQYLTPGGGFKFIFTIVFFAGLAAAVPLLIQQAYAFLSPVLSDKVRKRSGWLLLWSTILLGVGVTFGYIYAVPGALRFLYGFADQFVVSALTADSYLDFVIKYTLGLGLMFQIPLVMMVTHWIKPQKPLKLLKFERWVILIAFILAAIITPTPDPVNQTIIAIPIIAVYQVGLVAICWNIWRSNKVARQERRATRRAEKMKTKRERKSQKKNVPGIASRPAIISGLAVVPASAESIVAADSTKSIAVKPRTISDFRSPHSPPKFVNGQKVSIVQSTSMTVPPVSRKQQTRLVDGFAMPKTSSLGVKPTANRHQLHVPPGPSKAKVAVPQRTVSSVSRVATPVVARRRGLSIDGIAPTHLASA